MEESAARAGLPETFGPSGDPESKVDLTIEQPKGFEIARREVELKETVKVMHEMLAEHDLLPAEPPPTPAQIEELKDAFPKPRIDLRD